MKWVKKNCPYTTSISWKKKGTKYRALIVEKNCKGDWSVNRYGKATGIKLNNSKTKSQALEFARKYTKSH